MERWFSFRSTRFLVKALEPALILATWERIRKRELTEEEGFEVLFNFALKDFEGIHGGGGITRERKVRSLFQDPEVKNFVLQEAAALLTLQTSALLKCSDDMERYLVLSGNLKS